VRAAADIADDDETIAIDEGARTRIAKRIEHDFAL
jgi:hypothetical protein